MPRDSDIGRDLAAQLTTKFLGRVGEVFYTYDPYCELDQLEADKPYCVVSTNLYQHFRESRGGWREQIQLVITLISKVGATDNEKWVDEWLDSWDTILREAREISALGRHKPSLVESDSRYDNEMFQNYHRLFVQAVLTYGNVQR